MQTRVSKGTAGPLTRAKLEACDKPVILASCHAVLSKRRFPVQGAVVLVKAAASKSCKLKQLQLHSCGIADTAIVISALQHRAAEALANKKAPKKKKAKKKKGAKDKEDPAGDWPLFLFSSLA